MKITKKETSTILKDENNDFQNYLIFLENRSAEIEDENLVLDLLDVPNVSAEILLKILAFSEERKSRKYSFVLVTQEVEIEEVPEELSVVPSLVEAQDLIEMEEIERDLGF